MKKILSLFIIFLFFSMSSCKEEFFDINKNPNSPTDESITPNLILPRALHVVASRMATTVNYTAQWTGYWTRSGTFGPSNPLENYDITNGFQATQWSGWYDILSDIDIMEKKATIAEQNYYVGIAKVLKSIGFMYLVDQYNNVPYSKAFDLTNNILPSYDKGQDIYTDLLKQLDEAAIIFKSVDIDKNPGIKAADVLFGGNSSLWIKLANTQKLKLILRQSQVAGFNSTSEIAKITTNGGGYLMSGETAYVQPGYQVDNLKQNPFYNEYKFTYTGAIADTYNRASNYVLNKFRNNNDIRYQYFYSKANTPINGEIYYGYNFGEIISANDPHKSVNSSDVAGPGLAKSATQSQWLFTSVESLFLQAEATQRGLLTSVSPQIAYGNAVRESFIWLDVPNATAEANTYIASGSPIVDYATASNKLNLIINQKYLALIGINNFEAYTDYRRLAIPSDVPLSLAPSRGTRVIPKRLIYPTSEFSYNAANVAAEGAIDPQTDGVFWDK